MVLMSRKASTNLTDSENFTRATSSGLDAWYVIVPLSCSTTGVTLWHNATALIASFTRVVMVRRILF